ncbi:MAG TPA: hypothetical protein PKM65_09740 [Spirochaetota bacterium]|nr:hypothetical protein [Spirochaetota bacterium]HNT12689.1 hypothetical protein [Spirochaetota bacterium]HNV48250.1 hypothetical protein [Spirochaetota bacterium]HOS38180.1 hypothetical protein [Spirochaetota bacterium]HPU87323.1 hypothetical protein [Spirochaetota bacterium]
MGTALVHLIGLILLLVGWFVTIINVGMTFTVGVTKFSASMFNSGTLVGLVIIIIGAYVPMVGGIILNKLGK